MLLLGLQGGLSTWSFQVKVGMEHSRPRKQTASQYLPSLPDTLGMQKSCGAARHQKVLRLLGACGLVGRQKRQVPECAGLGQIPALGVSFLLFSPPKTIVDHSLGYAGSQGPSVLPSWSVMLVFVPFPCSHYSALAQTHHLRSECLHLPLNQFPCLQPLALLSIFRTRLPN